MASPVEAQVILCDAAQADPTGKMHMLGAGWSVAQTPTAPHALAIMVRVPWDRANQKIAITAVLLDADGHPVTIGEPPQEIRQDAEIEVGRPAGVAAGSLLPASLSVTVPPLPLTPGRYQWRVTIAEETFISAFQVVQPQQIGLPRF